MVLCYLFIIVLDYVVLRRDILYSIDVGPTVAMISPPIVNIINDLRGRTF